MNKILLIDKPKGWTSFDVVAKIRNSLKNQMCNLQAGADKIHKKKIKVGHAGTLDPFATGLLIVLVGDATKEQDQFMKLDKEYEATLKLGFVSTTGDPEGEITPFECHSEAEPKKLSLDLSCSQDDKKDCFVPCNDNILSLSDVQTALEVFRGEIMQTPPIYSAIKINGKRAYKLAREGQKVETEPRKVTIYDIQIGKYQYPELKIKVKCSSGTYIRTLAEDIGKKLGCGAYLTDLRRTKIGEYDINDAKTIKEVIENLK